MVTSLTGLVSQQKNLFKRKEKGLLIPLDIEYYVYDTPLAWKLMVVKISGKDRKKEQDV